METGNQSFPSKRVYPANSIQDVDNIFSSELSQGGRLFNLNRPERHAYFTCITMNIAILKFC